MTTKTLRSSSFSLLMNFDGKLCKGIMSGRSERGNFCFQATGKDFSELMMKFDGLVPFGEEFSEFYNFSTGEGAAGDGDSASGQGLVGQPPNCT